jgi:hypothetical protein
LTRAVIQPNLAWHLPRQVRMGRKDDGQSSMAAPRTAAAASASICKAAEFADIATAAFEDPRLPRPIDPDDEAAEPAAVLVARPLAEVVTVRGTAELAPPFPPSAAYAELAPAAASDEM